MSAGEKRGRAPNKSGTYYLGKDGWWHGRAVVGIRDDGKPDRRHVMGKTEAIVRKKIRDIERSADRGRLPKAGQRWTVENWLRHWLDNIAAPAIRATTLDSYRFAVNKHLVPGVGAHRIDRLEPEHLEKLYARMIKAGAKPATAHQAHRTIRTALNEAVRRGHLGRNPAVLAKAPRVDEDEIEPFDVDDVQRILVAAAKHRNRARWAVALALGLRQGEALGLKWPDVDLDGRRLTVRRSRQRPQWEHGCGGTCGRRKGSCPQRHNVRPPTSDTKSKAGRRVIGLPAELVELLRDHRVEQNRERGAAGQLWQDGGWVFAQPTGAPLHPRTDYQHWKDLLREAGVRDARLHDARHTAATVLLLLGVPERAAMGVMGWSSTSMAARYQHVTAQIQADIATRVGGLIWSANETRTETTAGSDDETQEG